MVGSSGMTRGDRLMGGQMRRIKLLQERKGRLDRYKAISEQPAERHLQLNYQWVTRFNIPLRLMSKGGLESWSECGLIRPLRLRMSLQAWGSSGKPGRQCLEISTCLFYVPHAILSLKGQRQRKNTQRQFHTEPPNDVYAIARGPVAKEQPIKPTDNSINLKLGDNRGGKRTKTNIGSRLEQAPI